jgi:hypothetical protein
MFSKMTKPNKFQIKNANKKIVAVILVAVLAIAVAATLIISNILKPKDVGNDQQVENSTTDNKDIGDKNSDVLEPNDSTTATEEELPEPARPEPPSIEIPRPR